MSETQTNKRALGVIFLTVVLDLVGFGIVIPLLSFYAEDYGASPLQVTLLMASYSAAQFLFAPLWGSLSDRFGRRPILLMSIAMTALMLAGFAWASELWLLFVFRSLHGVFAANISTAQAYVADVTSKEDRAKGMGMIGAGFGLGFTLGPVIGGVFAETELGLSLPIWIAAGLSALNFVLALALVKEPERKAPRDRKRTLKPADWMRVMSHPKVGAFIILSFAMTLAFSMMESTFALFEEHQHELSARQVGYVLGVIGIVGIVIQGGLIGRLSKRFGEGALVRIGIPGLGLALIGLAYAPPWGPLLAVGFLLAVFQSLAQPSLFSLISRQTPDSEQGFVLGTNQSLSALARAVAPAIAGLAFERVSERLPFFLSAGVLLICTFLAFRATARLTAPVDAPTGGE
ncbi:MAG: MFS transporter [Myxococcota bacterium]|nr:MFS transporter [Myxococcota bacterium]